MSWPTSQDYNEAVQSPGDSFTDPQLQRSRAWANPLGMPIPHSGNFADVYCLMCPDTNRSWAVKCFTRYIPNLHQRYDAIASHLKNAQLPFMVDFTFLDQGICVRGDLVPCGKDGLGRRFAPERVCET
jgi:hypothetical protein